MRRHVPTLYPLGSGPMMPALILGYELRGSRSEPWRALDRDLPHWLLHVAQQAGGYAMRYPEVVGAVFRLEANRSFAHRDPASLLRAFHLMAEDPRLGELARDYPELRPLCGTRGEDYARPALDALHIALAGSFRLPRPSSGLEAFVRFEPADASACVGGWKMVCVRDGVDRLEEGSTQGTWSDGGAFGSEELKRLEELRSYVAPDDAAPQLFLIWENSD